MWNGPPQGARRHDLSAGDPVRDDVAVPGDVLALEVLEQPAAPADEHQQPTAAVVVVLVRLEVLGQVRDAPGQHRDLHLGGARVARRTGRAP